MLNEQPRNFLMNNKLTTIFLAEFDEQKYNLRNQTKRK
jgi:hypothetical protein